MWARNLGWLFSGKVFLLLYSSQQLKNNSHSQEEVHFAQRQVGAPCRWAAEEAAAGTDGKSCYECNTDPWETVLHILQHSKVLLQLSKKLGKKSRTKLELRFEAAYDWYSEVIFYFSFLSLCRRKKAVFTAGPGYRLGPSSQTSSR